MFVDPNPQLLLALDQTDIAINERSLLIFPEFFSTLPDVYKVEHVSIQTNSNPYEFSSSVIQHSDIHDYHQQLAKEQTLLSAGIFLIQSNTS